MHPITDPKHTVSWMRRSAIAFCLALPLFAQAQAWPNKPIKWIIPYPPGGITDNATRMVVQKITEQTGWTIIIENNQVPTPSWGLILLLALHLTAIPLSP